MVVDQEIIVSDLVTDREGREGGKWGVKEGIYFKQSTEAQRD